ncbi:MAG: bifunctional 5,10-methylenetetrahydrofolate dehydrogenase/5,10-methenyltetrahydrofolate cyclohydrolase [bacterium]
MSAEIFDGKAFAKNLEAALKERVARLRRPPVAAVFYGSNVSEVASYVKSKSNRAQAASVSLRLMDVATMPPDLFLAHLEQAGRDPEVDAVVVELPLPFKIERDALFSRIPPEKDADGFHPANLGRLFAGEPLIAPATPVAVIRILDAAGIALKGKDTVVIGRSLVVGRPLVALLILRDATVTVCHTKTQDLAGHAKRAEILVAAAGKPGIVTTNMVRPGAVVIDVGVNYVNGKMTGDVEFDRVKEIASFITPVPGGVGPVTTIALLENIVAIAERRA